MDTKSHRVLFVDDEAPILNVMRRVFRLEPYEIRFAGDASEALEIFDAFRPAVVVSDHRMPGMTGTELLARIKELDPDTVRIILTGHTDLAVAEDAINSGQVYRFLTKPWNDDELRAAVAAGLETYELRDERARLVDRLEQLNATLADRLAEQSRELDDRTQELDRSRPLADLGLLAAGVAHELNNPLGGLLAITQLKLADADPGSQDEEDLKFIEEAALRCKAIVADLRSLAAPHHDTTQEACRVEGLIERGLQLLARDSRTARVPVERAYDPRTPQVLANPDQIARIVMNLVENGIHACFDDGAQVRVSTWQEDQFVAIAVDDNGPGIDPESEVSLFKPFYTTRPAGEGTGLGLAVSRALARANGGDLILASGKARQTRFVLRIPVAPEGGEE